MNIKQSASIAAVAITVLFTSSLTAQEATTNRIVRWFEGKNLPKLDVTQAETYAQENERRPEALLAACQASGERAFLREAMAKHPRDPRVAFAAASGKASSADGADERRKWLDTFKQCAPENGLAYHLSALDHFKTGQPEIAEQEVLAGLTRPMRDYALDFIENTEKACRSAGYSEPEALSLAMAGLLMPQLAQLRDLGTELVARAQSYRQDGKIALANKMVFAAARVGAQLDRTNSLTILEQLVGISIQQNALKALEPTASFPNSGQTVQSESDRLSKRRAAIRDTAKDFNKLFQKMSDHEIGNYFSQQKLLGEEAAERQALAR